MATGKLRVKAAFIDKQSQTCFSNLTPVGTWVEPNLTVAEILPTLTKRFWAVVASELLDDDDEGQPQWAKSNIYVGTRPQQQLGVMMQPMEINNGSPYIHASGGPHGTPGKSSMMGVIPGTSGAADPSATGMENSWVSGYPNIPMMTSADGTPMPMTSTPTDSVLGKRPAEDAEDRECPLPFLRDIST
eukprot:scaffold74633_cov43-Prasinocladus_malaysianus.AAC.1